MNVVTKWEYKKLTEHPLYTLLLSIHLSLLRFSFCYQSFQKSLLRSFAMCTIHFLLALARRCCCSRRRFKIFVLTLSLRILKALMRSCSSRGIFPPLARICLMRSCGGLTRLKSQMVACGSDPTAQWRTAGKYPSAQTITLYSPGFNRRQ